MQSQSSNGQVLVPISYEFTYVTNTGCGRTSNSLQTTPISTILKRGSRSQTITPQQQAAMTATETTSSPITTTTSVTTSAAAVDYRKLAVENNYELVEEEEVEIIIDLNGTKTVKEETDDGDDEAAPAESGPTPSQPPPPLPQQPKVEEEILRNIIMHLIPTTKKSYVDDILEGVKHIVSINLSVT